MNSVVSLLWELKQTHESARGQGVLEVRGFRYLRRWPLAMVWNSGFRAYEF